MSEESKSTANAEGALAEHIAELMQLALTSPAEALPRIEQFERILRESGGSETEAIHILYFLVYGKMAALSFETAAQAAIDDIVALCDKAICEHRIALELAQYDELETYQEEVVVKPGGLFRRPQTETQTRTRTVRKSRLNPADFADLLDYLFRALENCAPGRISQVFGEVKLKYLAAANRVLWAPVIKNAVNDGLISEKDLLAIGEVPLKASGPIRSARVNWLGPTPEVMISYSDSADPTEAGKSRGITKLKKSGGTWAVS
jgi:hypothetical protein